MSNYYRIKTDWVSEQEDGDLKKTKTEELVYADSYTEAEKVASELIRIYDRNKYGDASYEIIKTKISELLFDDILKRDEETVCGLISSYFEEPDTTGVGLYQVKVYYTFYDEESDKEKHTTESIFTPARSNADANAIVLNHLKAVGETRDYVVRDAKYDKAEAVLWPPTVYESLVNRND